MITNEFYSILCEIAYGLRNKVKKYDAENKKQYLIDDNYNHYVKDPYLIRSINKLYAFALKNKCINEKGEVLAPKDETQAIENFFSFGIGKWIDNWCESMKKALRDFIDIEPLVVLAPNNKFILTETCKELAMECTIYDRDAEQYKLFKQLRKLEQLGYVVCRKYLILNPIINSLQISEFKAQLQSCGVNEDLFYKILNLAYERIPDDAHHICSNCGWTVSERIDGIKQCIDWRCTRRTDNYTNIEALGDTRTLMRLKPGIMRYISIPGRLELMIEKFCIDNNIKYELWPHYDDYDIKIYLPNGKIIAVDAKDYRDAFVLGYNLLSKTSLFGASDMDDKYIVVLDDVAEIKFDYCDVVNTAINKKFVGVSCIKYSELLSIIRSYM